MLMIMLMSFKTFVVAGEIPITTNRVSCCISNSEIGLTF